MKTPILRKTLLAVLISAAAGSASAAGLGRINVFSSLGQPLRAEVEIAATPEEIESMSAKIASVDAFSRAKIEYVGELSSVRMAIERRPDGKSVIKVTSDREFGEPFVDMLIELNWAGGRLLREYTFLLDPAEMNTRSKPELVTIDTPKTPSYTAPSVASRNAPKTAFPPSVAATTPPAPSRTTTSTSSDRLSGDEYTVARGDTLRAVAETFRSDEVTRDQMLAALYKANKKAFVRNNINLLKEGAKLRVPDIQEVKQLSNSAARKVVLSASGYEVLAKQVATNAQTVDHEKAAKQGSSGQVQTKVSAPKGASSDRLLVSSTKSAKSGKGSSSSDIELDLRASKKAQEEAESRVAELERNNRELKQLLDMSNEQLAKLQQKNSASDKPPAVSTKVNPEPVQSEPVAAPVVESGTSASQNGAAVSPVDAASDQQSAAASEPVEVAPVVAVESAPVVKPPVAPPAPAPVREEPSFFDEILDNPLIPLGAGGAVVLLILLAFLSKKRKNKQSLSTGMTDSSEMVDISLSPSSALGRVGGQTIDTNSSMLHTDFSQSSLTSIDTNEGVDPVAEADVYMAYGRDAQAEEILLDARKNDPNRLSVVVKLLEIYAQRQSVEQFDTLAKELYAHTGGAGVEWTKTAEMGRNVNPANTLYQPRYPAALAAAAAAAKPAPVQQQQQPTAAPVPAQPVHAPVTASKNPTNLDFNLDLEIPHGEEPDTEMDVLGLQEVQQAPVAAPTPAPAAKPKSIEVAYSDSFLSGADTAKPAPSPVKSTLDFSLDQGAFEDDDASFAVEDLEKTNFEDSMLKFDFDLSDEISKVKSPKTATLGVDTLTDSYFDQEESSTVNKLANTDLSASTFSSSDLSGGDDELSTRLELARVYQETGDTDGARELLEEVIAHGKPAQQELARRMLASLD